MRVHVLTKNDVSEWQGLHIDRHVTEIVDFNLDLKSYA
jgi:hypothetical protein